MRLSIFTVGNKMPAWVDQGCNEYLKRLQGNMAIQLVEIPLANRGKTTNTETVIRKEGDSILQAIEHKKNVVALDVEGKQWSTEQLAQQMQNWQMDGGDISFIIGGPDGLDQRCLDKAQQHWSLSKLTLPHPLVRVVLFEQLYRAWSINNNHPYHRS